MFSQDFLSFVHSNTTDENTGKDDNTICSDCGSQLMPDSDYKYICQYCGLTSKKSTEDNTQVKTGINLKSFNRPPGKGNVFYSAQDYSITQFNTIIALFEKCSKNSKTYIPANILSHTARLYNRIQIMGGKNFVRRGNKKKQILAALIMKVASTYGIEYNKKTVAEFIGLKSSGISSGEDDLIEVLKRYKIKIGDKCDTYTMAYNFADRYINNLGLPEKYIKIVADIVMYSEEHVIGMNNQLSSKVAGAIYGIVQLKKYPMKCSTIEKACDNCKKNTFNKFWERVKSSPDKFDQFLKQI